MNNQSPPQPPPLAFPPSFLNPTAAREAHHDSAEYQQYDRYRTAQELRTIERESPEEYTAPETASSANIRSRGSGGTKARRSALQEALRRYTSTTSTQPDELGPDGYDEPRYRLTRQIPHWYDPIVRFWTRNVSVTIDEGAHRDHLALERTFLSYLRTSLALVMTGVVTAQLFRLQNSLNPNRDFGFFVIGVPLSSVFIGLAMMVLLIGAYRFWKQQNAMIRGKVWAGGWEINTIMMFTVMGCFVTFILVIVIDIQRSYF